MTSSDLNSPRLIAFYLTQFHPIPENDLWWGKGFTEWTNVTKATPQYLGHYQPHLPTDFGFYDLRVRQTRRDQIRIAKSFGIDGFCYHYYWFSGKRLLEQPLDDMLADTQSDMPFCLCWANENWTRRWDAAEHEVLIAQRYRENDDVEFIQSLFPFFSDPRYIRIEGRPFLIVYRPQHLPDARASVKVWREQCRRAGIGEIYVCAALTHGNFDYIQFNFDGGVEFPPHNLQCQNYASDIDFYAPFSGHVFRYEDVANAYLGRSYANPNIFRGVFPAWDNTSRTGGRAVMAINTSPENYQHWLSMAIQKTQQDFPKGDRLIFINAWNEWAEGCHLEPDRKYGNSFLEATLAARTDPNATSGFREVISNIKAETRRSFSSDVYRILHYHMMINLGLAVSTLKRFPRIRRILKWIWNQLS